MKLLVPGQRVRVSVPATVGNVGPGFDAIGLALELRDELTVSTTDGGLKIAVEGEGADDVPRDERHLVVRVLRDYLAEHGYSAPGLAIEAHNVIPHGRGLGSSAAAIVSGAMAAAALLPEPERTRAMDSDRLFRWCAAQEGHPDNVAPAVFGSLVISWAEDGSWEHAVVPVNERISPVVAIPTEQLPTHISRALLPATVAHSTAAANGARTALLIHAVSAEPALLLPATHDYLHQDYRAEAMARSAQLLRDLRGAGYAAVVSGAGPTVLTLAASPEQADEVAGRIDADSGDWRVVNLAVSREGVRVMEHLH